MADSADSIAVNGIGRRLHPADGLDSVEIGIACGRGGIRVVQLRGGPQQLIGAVSGARPVYLILAGSADRLPLQVGLARRCQEVRRHRGPGTVADGRDSGAVVALHAPCADGLHLVEVGIPRGRGGVRVA